MSAANANAGGRSVVDMEQRPFPFFHGHIRDATARQLVQADGYGTPLLTYCHVTDA
jgi:hypothetical protein